MTIEEFTQENIDKVTVTPRLNGAIYLIQAKEGYCILTPENTITDENGNVYKTYKYTITARPNYNFETIQIFEIDSLDLGEGDIIAGVIPPNEIA